MNYEITEEQIKQLAKGNAKVKEWFPEVFETELEVGRWYRRITGNTLSFICEPKGDAKVKSYGFSYNVFYNDTELDAHWGYMNQLEEWTPATDTEVLEALTNEAKKRGFKKGVCFNIVNGEREPIHIDKNERYGFDNYGNKLLMNNWCIFENGKWAEIIKTYTKKEAEKLLNAKII